ncbi:MerR family transcriptional regulator [Acholeplasma equirhinis]|uniref:MerR family transcriptional regulator n=1 Tax=Acholeplasma equirhinis TaxID=555393 RepID=UPI00197A7F88|nr:MerR family transcriptional regulator [Acholeplasma equirhinis]MBN3490328.1 MerR family transcriptional regulator [Acholeplasma equirhinis]
MTFKNSELAKLAGISTRTLRYYDQVNLLKPKRNDDSNYRYYSQDDVDKLQHILILKEMGLEIEAIKKLLKIKDLTSRIELFGKHLVELNLKKSKLEKLISNVNNTIKAMKGEIKMSDQSKFEGLKDDLIKHNEETYKEEVISFWGQKAYEDAKKYFKNMSEEKFNQFNQIQIDLIHTLQHAKENPNDLSLREKAARLHKEWIMIAWGKYNLEAHHNLVKMYVDDERFKRYYDQHGEGLAKLLRDSVLEYIK